MRFPLSAICAIGWWVIGVGGRGDDTTGRSSKRSVTAGAGRGHPSGLSAYPCGDDRLAIGGMRMSDAGLELELATAQDLCRIRQPSCWGVWSGVDVSVSSRSSRCLQKRWHQERTFRQSRVDMDCCRPRFISGAVWPSLGLSVCRCLGAAVVRGGRNHQGCSVTASAGSGRQAGRNR